ncbi:hypothetical protein FRC08_004478 [Ceratobasidium sp. 394]|nr:hypothetical protein FRC08_004478 [Ceratobasidium sp. 394]
MNGLDNSDEIQPKHDNEHTILITDGGESPLSATSPTLTDSDISDQNDGEHALNTSGSSQELPKDGPDAHQPDDAGPQSDDIPEIRGRSDPRIVPGKSPRAVPSDSSEGRSRGPNLSIAQGHPPVSSGPSPIGSIHLLPITHADTPPPTTPTHD